MSVENVVLHSQQELIARIRGVHHRHDTYPPPYTDAFISLETLNPELLVPAQNYVLTYELVKINGLRLNLMDHGVDIFKLDGFVTFTEQGMGFTLLPPVVEEYISPRGDIIPLICDGMHRIFTAACCDTDVQVLYIRGIPKGLPFYAYPVPSGWRGVTELSELPPGYIKKYHRHTNHKYRYRDFNTAFDNVGDSRVITPESISSDPLLA